MTIEYQVEGRRLTVLVDGDVGQDDFTDLFARLDADPEFGCELDQLWVFSGINFESFRPYHVQSLARIAIDASSTPRVAFVAGDDLTYGMCRVYQGWADPSIELEVFRLTDEAERWFATNAA